MPQADYLVGIDLGTTNSALAWINIKEAESDGPKIRSFQPEQVIRPFELGKKELLPSFIYFPNQIDLPSGSFNLPWDLENVSSCNKIIGEFARLQGIKVPGRCVHSAKSWLACPRLDRLSRILPWDGAPDVQRISPLEASSLFLAHLAACWNNFTNGKSPLQDQKIVLTIPASFDDAARTLTLQAAKLVGLSNILLLEEPQAAFYCWQAEGCIWPKICSDLTALIIDIGGGTTDFSLIKTIESNGQIAFERSAVGEHLLLGGDNIDTFIANLIEKELKNTDHNLTSHIVQLCRDAKEVLLGDDPPESYPVIFSGKGRLLVGSTVKHNIASHKTIDLILNSFFPLTGRNCEAPPRRHGAIQIGLPYATDPSISAHLATFLKQHMPGDKGPDALLLNGGMFHSRLICQRVQNVLTTMYPNADIHILEGISKDHAVARGAAYLGWLTYSGGRRITGGTARSYYLGISTNGLNSERFLCVLPSNATEGAEFFCDNLPLELKINEIVQFPLYASTVRLMDQAGLLVETLPDQLKKLPPLESYLSGGKKSKKKVVSIQLRARQTAIGTLELDLMGSEKKVWRLEFNLRSLDSSTLINQRDLENKEGASHSWGYQEEILCQAEEAISHVFPFSAPQDGKDSNSLVRDLECIFNAKRSEWPVGTCRRLWDTLALGADKRRQSHAHLARWYNLAGWLLRPGYGASGDPQRIESLWKILHAPPHGSREGMRQPESGPDLWILFRRVAGGLSAGRQSVLFDRIKPFLLPGKSKIPYKPTSPEIAEMWRCLSLCELIPYPRRIALADNLARKTSQRPVPDWMIWSIGRFGARLPLYGSVSAILPATSAAAWIKLLLVMQLSSSTELRNWCFALAQMAQICGQMDLEIQGQLRAKVAIVLEKFSWPPNWKTMLDKPTPPGENDWSSTYGDHLPVGLQLGMLEIKNEPKKL